jgi:tRNA (guanine37-N1)-methyltransferase
MKAVKVLLKDAQKVKEFLIKNNNLNPKFKAKKDSKHLYFPINFDTKEYEVVDIDLLEVKEKVSSLKELVKENLTLKELEFLKTSYDTIGSIAIVEIEKELEEKEKFIAEKLLSSNKTIKTVLKKQDKHQGQYRIQKLKFLLGEETKETIHKENGVLVKVNVEEVYFSPRLSNDRKRIASMIKKGELVVVVGSGAGPYPLVFSKLSKAKRVVGIEFNPKGHELALINKKINKLSNIDFILGDGTKELAKFELVDRIVLATPDNSNDFLETAFRVVNKGGFIHANYFSKEEDFDSLILNLKEIAKKAGKKVSVDIVKNGQHAPYVFRVSADINIL